MTTSTCSASVTGLPDRRLFLSTIAASGALGLPALPAVASASGPLEAMYPEFLRLARAYDAAIEVTWDAEERYDEPDRPRWHPGTAEGGYKLERLPGNKCHCYLNDSDENIAELKAIIAKSFVPDPTHAVTEYSHRARVERARKTLDAIETWQAEAQRRREAAGLTSAAASEHEARTVAAAHRDAMLAIEASTWRELAFQAAVVTVEWSERRTDLVLERLVELAGIEPYIA